MKNILYIRFQLQFNNFLFFTGHNDKTFYSTEQLIFVTFKYVIFKIALSSYNFMYPINSLLSANCQVQNIIINCSTMQCINCSTILSITWQSRCQRLAQVPAFSLIVIWNPRGTKRSTRTAHQKSTFCTLVVFWDPKLIIPKYCICHKFKTSYQKNYKNCKQQVKLKKHTQKNVL